MCFPMPWGIFKLMHCVSTGNTQNVNVQNVDFSFPQSIEFVPFPSHNASIWRSTIFAARPGRS